MPSRSLSAFDSNGRPKYLTAITRAWAPGGSLLAQRTHPIVYPLQSTTTRSPLAGLFPRPTVAS